MTLALLLAATPAPLRPRSRSLWEVSPGIEGFFYGFFVLAVAAILLSWSMVRHMRKIQHNQRVRDRAEGGAAADGAGDGVTGDGGATGAGAADAAAAGDRATGDGATGEGAAGDGKTGHGASPRR